MPFNQRKLEQHIETHLPEIYNPNISRELRKKLLAVFGQPVISKYFNERQYHRRDESKLKPKELRDIEIEIWYHGKDCDIDSLKEDIEALKHYAHKRPDHAEYVRMLITDVQDGIRSLWKNRNVGVILVEPNWAGGHSFSGEFSHLQK